jgi:hypothetical protein
VFRGCGPTSCLSLLGKQTAVTQLIARQRSLSLHHSVSSLCLRPFIHAATTVAPLVTLQTTKSHSVTPANMAAPLSHCRHADPNVSYNTICTVWWPRQRSRYSDWLRARRPRSRSSSPGRVKDFLFFRSSRLALGLTQPPIQWVSGLFSRG